MAIVEVKVPQLSESIAEATMLNWKKKAGEAVAVDEILIEIETDKVVLEVPAPAAGVLSEIVQGDGATVTTEQADCQDRHRGRSWCGCRSCCRRRNPCCSPPLPPRAAAACCGNKGDVAMPAAAKLLAENNLCRCQRGWLRAKMAA